LTGWLPGVYIVVNLSPSTARAIDQGQTKGFTGTVSNDSTNSVQRGRKMIKEVQNGKGKQRR